MRYCVTESTLIEGRPRLLCGVVLAAVAYSCSLSTLSAQSQSQPTVVPPPALANCYKRFRLAEIDAQVPHQRGAMVEFCSDVETSCKTNTESLADCDRAIARLDRSLASATAVMKGVSRPGT
jgi:hypothetical protein